MTIIGKRKSTATVLVAGVDEAGRGPLAGPVIAAVVILDPRRRIAGLDDSKRLTKDRRNELAALIHRRALAWAVGRAEVEEIDRLNIFRATLLAMKRAVDALTVVPCKILVDGTHCPDVDCAAEAIVRGDQTVPSISAASILAKVTRDREMVELDGRYPGYGFAAHKGYSTAYHFDRLRELGVSPVHRRSFSPVSQLLEKETAGKCQDRACALFDPPLALETAPLKLDT